MPMMIDDYNKWVEVYILEESSQALKAQLCVDQAYPAFQGHFPRNPVLPAVSIVNLSLRLIENKEPHHSYSDFKLEKTRFKSMIRPSEKMIIEVQNTSAQNWMIQWRRAQTLEECVSLKVCFFGPQ